VVAAGIMRVVYIEPYPKSLARNLHDDSIRIEDSPGAEHRVQFEPFVGVAPRRYMDFFAMSQRKEKDGSAWKWIPQSATPRMNGWIHRLTVDNEILYLWHLAQKLPGRPGFKAKGEQP